METNRSHMDALELRLSHERVRLAKAKTDGERALRTVWIAQLEKEIAGERHYLGAEPELTDDELLAALKS